MHSLATDLVGGRKPNQYVQPYEHGTGHQKATGLYLTYNLPLIQPTCIMAERTSAMADLPRSPHRGALRSRTYIGIAAAMALQWMPTLLGYCKIRTCDRYAIVPFVPPAEEAVGIRQGLDGPADLASTQGNQGVVTVLVERFDGAADGGGAEVEISLLRRRTPRHPAC
eukprot:scaffold5601_cov104-Isochrysis_galbana.AAC.1